jgi:hypothetical protein
MASILNGNRQSPHLPECCRPAAGITRQRGPLQVEPLVNGVIRTRGAIVRHRREPGDPRISMGFCVARAVSPVATMLPRLLLSRSNACSLGATEAASKAERHKSPSGG